MAFGCSRPAPAGNDAGVASIPSSTPPDGVCSSLEKLAQTTCRNGKREVTRVPEDAQSGFVMSHCPLDDCGSGGCTYDVYVAEGACLRAAGSVHGLSFDVAVPASGSAAGLRTWGRSGTTHVATEYELTGGKLVKQRQFVCDYGSGKPLPPECPKL